MGTAKTKSQFTPHKINSGHVGDPDCAGADHIPNWQSSAFCDSQINECASHNGGSRSRFVEGRYLSGAWFAKGPRFILQHLQAGQCVGRGLLSETLPDSVEDSGELVRPMV